PYGPASTVTGSLAGCVVVSVTSHPLGNPVFHQRVLALLWPAARRSARRSTRAGSGYTGWRHSGRGARAGVRQPAGHRGGSGGRAAATAADRRVPCHDAARGKQLTGL